MILELFIFLFILTFVIIGFGYYLNNVILKVVGITFLFLVGVQLEMGIEYKIGDTITEISLTETSIVSNYSTFNSHSFGYFLIVLSVFWGVLIWTNYKKEPEIEGG